MLKFNQYNSKRIYKSLIENYDENKPISFRDLDYIVNYSLDLELNQKFINSYNDQKCFTYLEMLDLKVEFKLIKEKKSKFKKTGESSGFDMRGIK